MPWSIMTIWSAIYSLTVDARDVVVPVVLVYPFIVQTPKGLHITDMLRRRAW